jgi:hypothetical protein
VTIDGVWMVIGFIEYLQIKIISSYSAKSDIFCSSLQHVLNRLSLLCVHLSLSINGFQCRRSLEFRVHVLTGRQLSHNSPNSRLVLHLTPRHGQHRNLRFQEFYCCVTHLSHGQRRVHTPLLNYFIGACQESFAKKRALSAESLLSNQYTCYNINFSINNNPTRFIKRFQFILLGFYYLYLLAQ